MAENIDNGLRNVTNQGMEKRRTDREQSLPQIQEWLASLSPEEQARAFLAQRRRTERAEFWADVDQLTGLPRRQIFTARTLEEMKRVNENSEERGLRIGIGDIDGFGVFNKKYGELVGDDVLSKVGHNLMDATRSGSDTPSRYGGEEFAVVMPFRTQTSTFEQRVLSAERVRKAAGTRLENKGETITLSFGTTEYKPEKTYEDCFNRASRAQRAAKRLGKNRTVSAVVTDQGDEFFHDLSSGKIYRMNIPNPEKPDEFELQETG